MPTQPITDNPPPPTIVERLRGMDTYGYQSQLACRAADLIDELTGALRVILLYVDPEGEGTFDGARELAGIKSTGEMVLKGSFIAVCSRAADVLAKAGAR